MKSVQPGLCSFIDPTAGLRVWMPTFFRCFVSARLDVPAIVATLQAVSKVVGIVRFVGTHMLRSPRSWLRPVNRYTVERRYGQLEVMAIGRSDRQTQDDAANVGEHRTLDAPLATIGRIWPGFPPLPAAPCSSPCRASANASRCHDDGRIQPVPVSTTYRTHHDCTTSESNDAGCCPSRTLLVRPSTGSRSSSQSRCHRRRAVVPTAAAPPWDVAVVSAITCEVVAKAHQASPCKNLQ